MNRALNVALVGLSCAACLPDVDVRVSRVDAPRIVAVRGEPAESRPGVATRYTALLVTAGGTAAEAPIQWSTCDRPRAPIENGDVPAACLQGGTMTTAGGLWWVTSVPREACNWFGPDVPAGQDQRPRDPDDTGGYFLPVRLEAFGQIVFHQQRVTCSPANANGDVAREFLARYLPNQHPRIEQLWFADPTTGATLDPESLPAGPLDVRVSWGESAEHYVALDVATQRVLDRRESIRVGWLSTAGDFEVDHSGRAEDDLQTWSSNRWTVPPGRHSIWAVVRDARGGTDWVGRDVLVR